MTDFLEFDSIELAFAGRKILSSIHMQCKVGQIVGLLGRNGTGKSCLMKVVFGSMDAQHKHIRVNDVPLGEDYLRKRVIAYLPQENLIPGNVTIRMALDIFVTDSKKAIEVFPQVRDFLDFRPAQLSGGYRRIIETLLILFSPAQFCILDEPFSGLMPVHIETIMQILSQAKVQKGIIITDHMHRHVTTLSDKIYVLKSGKCYPVRELHELVNLGYLNDL